MSKKIEILYVESITAFCSDSILEMYQTSLSRLESRRVGIPVGTSRLYEQSNHERIFNRRSCVDEERLKKINLRTRSWWRLERSRKSFKKDWKHFSHVKRSNILHRCCTRFKNKNFNCVVCVVLSISSYIQNVKFKSRNEHKWCRAVRDWKNSLMI